MRRQTQTVHPFRSFIYSFPTQQDCVLPVARLRAPIVQTLDNAIHRINLYPVDKYWQNKPRYTLDSDLSGG